jgi:DNA-damage-inducible protein J
MTTFTFRLDEKLKKDFQDVCEDLGMDASTAFKIFAKKLVQEKRIPFNVSVSDEFNETTIKAMQDAKNNVGLSKCYSDVDEMFKDILND